MPPNVCPSRGSTLDFESKFCAQCGLNVASSAEFTAAEISSSTINCPNCQQQINLAALFCWNCGRQIGLATSAKAESRRSVAIVLAVCLGIALLYILLSRNSKSTTVTSATTTFQQNISSVSNRATEPERNKLTNVKVEQAINQLTSNLRVGGTISVDGIQELPRKTPRELICDSIAFNTSRIWQELRFQVTSERQRSRKYRIRISTTSCTNLALNKFRPGITQVKDSQS